MTAYLMPLYSTTGGEEDADSQGYMTNTLCCMVELFRVEVVVLQSYGAHQQAAEEEEEVCQAEEQ